ncbi:MAG: hypothetical protein HY298_07140 [Verrucomicrobia bacterium]|nr:hypothetical protein [Verrucomicrobiota bacterium]
MASDLDDWRNDKTAQHCALMLLAYGVGHCAVIVDVAKIVCGIFVFLGGIWLSYASPRTNQP